MYVNDPKSIEKFIQAMIDTLGRTQDEITQLDPECDPEFESEQIESGLEPDKIELSDEMKIALWVGEQLMKIEEGLATGGWENYGR